MHRYLLLKARLDPPQEGSCSSSQQHCIGGQVTSEHHPPSGRKQVGHDRVFRHSGYVWKRDKARSPRRCYHENLQEAGTQLHYTSIKVVPPFGTTTDKIRFSRGSKHHPDHSTQQHFMLSCWQLAQQCSELNFLSLKQIPTVNITAVSNALRKQSCYLEETLGKQQHLTQLSSLPGQN